MKAAVIYRYGAPDVFQIAEVERPTIKPDQLLVKVFASSINPIEWKMRKGMLKILTGSSFPIALGFDVSGEAVEVGTQTVRSAILSDQRTFGHEVCPPELGG